MYESIRSDNGRIKLFKLFFQVNYPEEIYILQSKFMKILQKKYDDVTYEQI